MLNKMADHMDYSELQHNHCQYNPPATAKSLRTHVSMQKLIVCLAQDAIDAPGRS